VNKGIDDMVGILLADARSPTTTRAPTPPTSSFNPQRPGAPYYQPYTSNGPYETAFEKGGNDIGNALITAGTTYTEDPVEKAALVAIGNVVATISSKAFGSVGFAIDNFDAINKNMDTLMQELSSSSSWVAPSPAD
jgi:hypothetical protein